MGRVDRNSTEHSIEHSREWHPGSSIVGYYFGYVDEWSLCYFLFVSYTTLFPVSSIQYPVSSYQLPICHVRYVCLAGQVWDGMGLTGEELGVSECVGICVCVTGDYR